MTIRRIPSFIAAGLSIALFPQVSQVEASPELAEDRAYTVAAKFRDRGFYVQPVTSGLLSRGQTYRVVIPITRGLDYLIIGAGDDAATDIDIYVYSDLGTLVTDDRRSLSDALVQFRAQYTGEVYAYIHMARTDPTKGLPSWAAFVGRRGTVAVPDKSGGTAGGDVKTDQNAPPGDPVPKKSKPGGADGTTTPRKFNDNN